MLCGVLLWHIVGADFAQGGQDHPTQRPRCDLIPSTCDEVLFQDLFHVWQEKVSCWICSSEQLVWYAHLVTQHLLRERHPEILRNFDAARGRWLTTLGPGWEHECLGGYLLAAVASTRSPNVQPDAFYEFVAAIIDLCAWDSLSFFQIYNITPLQILYVLRLLSGHDLGLFDFSQRTTNPPSMGQFAIDVGFGLGGDSRYYLDLGLRVVGIEANPMSVKHARTQFARDLRRNLTLIEAAISSSPGNVTFYGADRLELSRTSAVNLDEAHRVFHVQATTCSAIFGLYGTPAYLKIDVESDSDACIESLLIANDTPPAYISIELEAGHCLVQFVAMLSEMGYAQFKICRQFLYTPARCEQNFTFGCSSGPFGEDAVDYLEGPRWRNKDSILTHYGWQEEFESSKDWFDLHAKL